MSEMVSDSYYVLPFHSEQAVLALVGGKGANLAQMVRAGLPVPSGFLVTTHAYRAYVEHNELGAGIQAIIAGTSPDDPKALNEASQQIRGQFEVGEMPADLGQLLLSHYHKMGSPPVAVRSSATAEDLPDMSFAGQQDTFLNVLGDEAFLRAVVACWSSLWTARAIGYRARNGIAHNEVALSVVVQEMVQSEASGVLFTVNPLNGKRNETVIDATLGLGEALVSGQVEPDHYIVDSNQQRILEKTLGKKVLVIRSVAGGGVETIEENAGNQQAITDEMILALTKMGQETEAFFGSPQDMEWGVVNNKLYLLQSRPITSLFPIPEGIPADAPLKVLFSFGAVQGMLDPMTPLGRDAIKCIFVSAGQKLFNIPTSLETQSFFWTAGERLFGDLTPILRHAMGRKMISRAMSVVEPGAGQAIASLLDDPRLTIQESNNLKGLWQGRHFLRQVLTCALRALRHPQQERLSAQKKMKDILAAYEASFEHVHRFSTRVQLYEEVVATAFPTVVPHIMPVAVVGMAQLQLLNRLLADVPNKPDVMLLTRGLPHNVTTEMDLALWQTAKTIQSDEASYQLFQEEQATALTSMYVAGQLPAISQQAITDFMKLYGMRGLAEIDFGRPRWRENPLHIIQTLQSYNQIEDGDFAPDVVFAKGEKEAEKTMEAMVQAVSQTRLGWLKAKFVRAAAYRVRELAGLRESPKFFIIQLFGLAREALLDSGQELVDAGILQQADDLMFLHLPELKALAQGEQKDWQTIIDERRQRHAHELKRRQIPRILLSDGQAFYEGVQTHTELGEGMLGGSPVSPGIVEGKVRVVFDPHGTQLLPGEILVCPGTDPAWTPLFLAAGGLVMEVGGLMTHGSVVAREYGIPAVVGVNQATTQLKTGQLVRVDGSAGIITILDPEESPNAQA